MVVQHNLTAMNANRQLSGVQSAQQKSTEKLSSGYRINRAGDDAAGLSISEKMRSQIRGLNKAVSNAQDGISLVQVAEGALTEVHSMLQRMNELATQAANGTNSKDSDRQAIQDEIDQLTTEIDRVSETTKFNETYLLKGEAGTKTINMKAHDAGLKGTLTDNGDGTATFVMDTLKAGDSVSIGGKNYTIGAEKKDTDDLIDKAATTGAEKDITINGKLYKYIKGVTGGDDSAADKPKGGYYLDGVVSATSTGKSAADLKGFATPGSTVSAAGKEITSMNTTDATAGVKSNDATVITAKKAYELAGKELLAANSIGDTEGKAKVGVGDNVDTAVDLTNGTGTYKIQLGQAKVANSLSFSLHVGADADMTNKIQVNIDAMDSASLGIKGLNVKDDSGNAATYAVDAISDAISKVSSQRSSLGAVQNRLEHTINNLDNVVENTTTAESRIRDTDMAEEMVNYSKNNILAQAGQSMLAQANQSNQGVLSLLQ